MLALLGYLALGYFALLGIGWYVSFQDYNKPSKPKPPAPPTDTHTKI